MKRIKYSPTAAQKLLFIKSEISARYSPDTANRITGNIKHSINKLKQFEKLGVSVEEMLGIECDYYLIFIEHMYVFYRITDEAILIVELFNEREDFMWKLFGIQEITNDSEH